MTIIEEHISAFCEIVRLGFNYYKERLAFFPKDYRIMEQVNHLNSIQDSIYKYDVSSKCGLIIRSTDIPYCYDLLKDASEFCDKELSIVANVLLNQNEMDTYAKL